MDRLNCEVSIDGVGVRDMEEAGEAVPDMIDFLKNGRRNDLLDEVGLGAVSRSVYYAQWGAANGIDEGGRWRP